MDLQQSRRSAEATVAAHSETLRNAGVAAEGNALYFCKAHGIPDNGNHMPQIPSGKANANERKYPFLIELTVAGKGLDVGLSRRIIDFHTTRHIQLRHGRSTFPQGEGQAYYRWCFSDLATAQSFIEQFGGTIIQRGSA